MKSNNERIRQIVPILCDMGLPSGTLFCECILGCIIHPIVKELKPGLSSADYLIAKWYDV